MNILEVKNVKKAFGKAQIIDDVSFEIKPNRIVGLLGKNGCGKTTILKMINDLYTIDEGEILVCGNTVGVESKKVISFLPERTYLDSELKIYEALDYFKTFYSDFDKEKALKLLNDLNLNPNMRLSKMSKGMKEKVQLALVMSRNAKLYILDEPLGGVDPTTRDYILKTILSNFNDGASLLITTHIISDVESILDDVIFLDNGKIILHGDADKLRQSENASINEIFRRVIK